jgi:cytochrome c551/c552
MTNEHPDLHEDNTNVGFNILFFGSIGLILILAIMGVVFWVQIVVPGGDQSTEPVTGFNFHSGERIRLEVASSVAEEGAATTAQDLDAVIAAIDKGGCVACHTIPNIPGAVGQVGPNLSRIGADAANRREGYTAEAYIRESLLEPSAFTAPECPTGPCPPGAMPQLLLDQTEIEVIVKYLTTLGLDEVGQLQ